MWRGVRRWPLLLGHCSFPVLFILPCIFNVIGIAQHWQHAVLTGRVTGVSDGDTITILGSGYREYKIRLNGIDAPEKGQAYGQASKESLSRMVYGREVRVIWQKQDRYGRILGRVYVGETDVNLSQLSTGLAWYYRKYERDVPARDRATFDQMEEQARRSRRGLWSMGTPTPPWDYRAASRGGGEKYGETLNPPTVGAPPTESSESFGAVRGNRNSGIYHLPACPDYEKISYRNRVSFRTEAEAMQNGFRKARNCP